MSEFTLISIPNDSPAGAPPTQVYLNPHSITYCYTMMVQDGDQGMRQVARLQLSSGQWLQVSMDVWQRVLDVATVPKTQLDDLWYKAWENKDGDDLTKA